MSQLYLINWQVRKISFSPARYYLHIVFFFARFNQLSRLLFLSFLFQYKCDFFLGVGYKTSCMITLFHINILTLFNILCVCERKRDPVVCMYLCTTATGFISHVCQCHVLLICRLGRTRTKKGSRFRGLYTFPPFTKQTNPRCILPYFIRSSARHNIASST